ncbi:hypothetical protein ACHQM5_000220 [Ranunculus cassubicifolius]
MHFRVGFWPCWAGSSLISGQAQPINSEWPLNSCSNGNNISIHRKLKLGFISRVQIRVHNSKREVNSFKSNGVRRRNDGKMESGYLAENTIPETTA